ncbi:peptide ABC transporter substrate-binding protein [Hyphomicrobium methylovorum]|uniref:GTP cyclohydrolase II n=1 Tax=Hyphomicrobium methylovorum TaxID=84 RepID=UPI0015E71E98|nr:GTP cyclohydrolase II [Hyphomicrobium methylovorum]MBA2125187.1 peptide ABC transporter substrate-binding protein [Hyphomicrobium methylovorum]
MSASREFASEALQHAATSLPIELGGKTVMLDAHAYSDGVDQLVVLLHRAADICSDHIPIVRIHSGCVTGDIFHSLRCDCRQQLQAALQTICDCPYGALVYLPYHEGRGIGLFRKLKTYALQDCGLDTIEANLAIGAPVDARDFTLASRALADLGMRDVRLLTNNPLKETALSGLGIRVVERVPLRVLANPHNERYLETKRLRMAHDC